MKDDRGSAAWRSVPSGCEVVPDQGVGPGGVDEVAGLLEGQLAGIPTSKVYETLERLKHKGAALVQRSEPTLWAPVPHRELVGRLRRDMEATCSAVEQGLAQLGYEQDTALTWSLSGRGHVVDSMGRAIGRARERLTGALPARELAELGASLAAAVERGVSVDLVTDDGATIDLPDW